MIADFPEPTTRRRPESEHTTLGVVSQSRSENNNSVVQRLNIDNYQFSLSETTVLVAACIAVIILIVITTTTFILLRRSKRFSWPDSFSSRSKLPPPYSSTVGCDVKLWLSEQQPGGTVTKSPIRNSWPAFAVVNTPEDVDRLSVVSHGALGCADVKRRLEERVSGDCRLYPKAHRVRSDSLPFRST